MINKQKNVPKYIDVSLAISPQLPRWPGSPEIQFKRNLDLEKGDVATDTSISFSVHTGTHVDAPQHFIKQGKSVDQLNLDQLIGEVYVAVLPNSVNVVTADLLQKLSLPSHIDRLLLRTNNSNLWHTNLDFQQDFVALTADAAQWIVNQNIKLIGVDYLSVQRYHDGPETHQILLNADIIIIEGLDLSEVSEGFYELLCLPIKLKGVEGAPARVILKII